MTCRHKLGEREASVETDGYCPICMAKRIEELLVVLEKIASLRYSNTSAASIAQSALDTMKVLNK